MNCLPAYWMAFLFFLFSISVSLWMTVQVIILTCTHLSVYRYSCPLTEPQATWLVLCVHRSVWIKVTYRCGSKLESSQFKVSSQSIFIYIWFIFRSSCDKLPPDACTVVLLCRIIMMHSHCHRSSVWNLFSGHLTTLAYSYFSWRSSTFPKVPFSALRQCIYSNLGVILSSVNLHLIVVENDSENPEWHCDKVLG